MYRIYFLVWCFVQNVCTHVCLFSDQGIIAGHEAQLAKHMMLFARCAGVSVRSLPGAALQCTAVHSCTIMPELSGCCRLALTQASMSINLDAMLTAVRDFFERSARELHAKDEATGRKASAMGCSNAASAFGLVD